MARANYNLQTIREGTVISSNGTTYTINILFNTTGGGTEMQFDSSGVQISYETPNQKDKNTYILASKCTIPFLVQNNTDKVFINSLSTDYTEREVWVTVREGSNMLWSGYVILDLKDEQDVSFPYEVNLIAIDGLASLKDIDFVRETNVDTGATPTFPYVEGDTFINAPYSNLLANTVGGTATKYISELISRTGQLLAADDTGGTTFLENYTIQTSVNYYNEEHPAPATNIDPLAYTRIKTKTLYTLDENNYVTPPSCFAVLEYICKNFGMRCVYWQHTFHFIQLNEYNTNENAAGTPTAPINIPTRLYDYQGNPQGTSSQNFVGNNNLSIYNLELENDTSNDGLQKLTGTIYSGLPAIKKVNAVYLAIQGQNVFSGFPLLPTTFAGSQTDYLLYPTDASGNQVWSVMSDVASTDGIRLKFDLSWKNTTNTNPNVFIMFVLVSREAGQTTQFPMKYSRRLFETNPISETWADWTSGTFPTSGFSAIRRWTKYTVVVPQSATINQNVGVLSYDSATDPFLAFNGGLFPVDTSFTGDKEFSILAWTSWDPTATNPMANNSTAYGSAASNGACYSSSGNTSPLNFDGTAFEAWQPIDDYKYDYNNTLNPVSGTSSPYSGIFSSVASQGQPIEYEAEVETNNSYIIDAGNYIWGEGATIQVSNNGSTYTNAGEGKWAKPTYAWNVGTSQFDYTVGSYNLTLIELNIRDIIFNQSIALKQFNGTTALSVHNKYYSGTTILKYFNPIARLEDTDGNKYMFMRGSFNIMMDEWSITSDEVFYEVPSETLNLGQRTINAEIQIENGN